MEPMSQRNTLLMFQCVHCFYLKRLRSVTQCLKSPRAHTVRDAATDISKIQQMLLDKKITTEDSRRREPGFIDPTVRGIDTLTKAEWLEKQLTSKVEDTLQSEQFRGELEDFDDN